MKFNPWPIGITLFCTAAFAGAATVVVVMVSKKVELVTPDYYAQDLKHGERMAQQERANALEKPVEIQRETENGNILVTFPDGVANGTITLYRPSNPALDRAVDIDLNENNQQIIPGVELAGGLWRVQCQWRQNELDYYYSEALVVP